MAVPKGWSKGAAEAAGPSAGTWSKYGAEWRSQTAHVEAFATLAQARARKEQLQREVVQRGGTLVVEGPDSGAVRLLTMHGSVIDQARIVSIDKALRDEQAGEHDLGLARALPLRVRTAPVGRHQGHCVPEPGGRARQGYSEGQGYELDRCADPRHAISRRATVLMPLMGGVMRDWE